MAQEEKAASQQFEFSLAEPSEAPSAKRQKGQEGQPVEAASSSDSSFASSSPSPSWSGLFDNLPKIDIVQPQQPLSNRQKKLKRKAEEIEKQKKLDAEALAKHKIAEAKKAERKALKREQFLHEAARPKYTRDVSPDTKKTVAGRQNFQCANYPWSNQYQRGLEGFGCPCWYRSYSQGNFDEAGYEIDHIVEHCLTGDDSFENLQALCVSCHRVKTRRFNIAKYTTQSGDKSS
jgi:5-methylcytosine-specific restriction endonuclease McrA